MLICTNLMKFKSKYIKWSRFEKRFSSELLEFTLVFYIFFLEFFQFFFEISKFELKITNF
jgi:hypothetical protein